MKPTTALRKISGLKKKIWGIQGGQGAGKTYSILIIIINHLLTNPGKEFYIMSAELSKMRDTVIKDFVNILTQTGKINEVTLTGIVNGAPRCDFPNKSFVRFVGLDKEDVGKGLRSDLIFANEANKIKFDTFREATSRTQKVIIDFNPNTKFWFHKEIMTRDDCDFLKLTFLDNEYLSESEKYEILLYKKKGYELDENGEILLDENGNRIIKNLYWSNMWRVYGEGEVGQVEGRIYNWNPISLKQYNEVNKEKYYGCDWGVVDPFAVVECKYSDGNLYVRELHYQSENEIRRNMTPQQLNMIKSKEVVQADGTVHEGLISWIFSKIGVPQQGIISCDNNRPNKIKSLRNAGWEYAVAVGGKSKLLDRIDTLQGMNVYFTEESENIDMEQLSYCYQKDKFGVQQEEPIDQDNHLIDAIAYCVQKMFDLGVIKSV